jgi:WD40 repeat protein
VSFKKLKNSGGGKKKKGQEAIPTHPAYVSQFKGITGRIVDSDTLKLEDNSMLLAVAEEQNRFRIYSFSSLTNQQTDVISCEGQAPGHEQFVSISIGPLEVSNPQKSATFILALACYDKCKVAFLKIQREGGKLKVLKEEKVNPIEFPHKMPANCVRLSKNYPNLVVTCGDEQDTMVKLWNLTQPNEPMSKIETSQVKHYSMGYGPKHDFFAVSAWTTDIKILRIVKEHGVVKGLQKVANLGGHKKETTSVSFCNESEFCLTTAKDMVAQLFVLNEYYNTAKVVGKIDL